MSSSSPPRSSTDTDFATHPTYFSDFPLKITTSGWKGTDQVDFHLALNEWVNKKHSHSLSAQEFLKQLTRVRGSTIFHLEQQETNLSKYSEYVSLLVGTLSQMKSTSKIEQGDDEGLSLTGSGGGLDLDKASNAISFAWREVLFPLANEKVEYWGMKYEMVQVLLAVALVLGRKAVQVTKLARGGVMTQTSQQIYQHYLDAAGVCKFALDYVDELVSCPALDCQKQAVNALQNFFMAEAQHITVLRAIAQGNQPGLIAALAQDTVDLYAASESYLQQTMNMRVAFESGGSCGLNFMLYVSFKCQAMKAIAFSFNGLNLLSEGEGGNAVRSCMEAKEIYKGTTEKHDAYVKYSNAQQTDNKEFLKRIEVAVSENLNLCKKNNESVYFQKVPDEVPALGEPKRLIKVSFPIQLQDGSQVVSPQTLGTFQPPGRWEQSRTRKQMAAAVVDGQSKKPKEAEDEQEELTEPVNCCCQFLRWVIVLILMPILLMITIVGIIVWIVLLPVKIICCPVGIVLQWIWNVVEWLIKAPFRAILWATGKPWKPVKQENKNSDDGKNKESKDKSRGAEDQV